MAKNRLEYDRKKCWNLTQRLHRRTLTIEHDRNMDEYDQKCINNKIYEDN